MLRYLLTYLKLGKMGFIFSKFSKLGSGAKHPSPNPSPSVAEANQLFEPIHSFWAGYATACPSCVSCSSCLTGMWKWLDIVERVVPIVISYKMNCIFKRNVSKFYNFLMFKVVTLKSLGLEVTGMRKWIDIVEHVVPIVISYKMNSIYKRNVSKFYKFLMFEVVTLKSLGLEVTGMRKWLDIIEHVVLIVISYKMNSIYERNVSKFYNSLMFYWV